MDLYDMRKPLTEFGISIDPEHGHALRSEAMRSDYLDWHAADKKTAAERAVTKRRRKPLPAIRCQDQVWDSGPHEGCSEWAESVIVTCDKPATHVVKFTEPNYVHTGGRDDRMLMCQWHVKNFEIPNRHYRFRRI